jgi:hypothetical protein
MGKNEYTPGGEASIKFFVLISTIFIIILKCLLALSIWIQKLKYERGHDEVASSSTVANSNPNLNPEFAYRNKV